MSSFNRQARLPNPDLYNNWKAWAKDVLKALRDEAGPSAPVIPQAVLLAQRLDGARASAAVDGVIMYSPAEGTVVVSVNGAWVPLVKDE